MITLENVTFKIIQDLDTIYLENLTDVPLPFIVSYQYKNNPDLYEQLQSWSIPALSRFPLTISKEGYYKIVTNEVVSYFSMFNTIRNEVIKAIRRAICDCGCTDCSRCEDKEGKLAKRNQALSVLLTGYTNLVKPFANTVQQKYNIVLFNFYQTIFNNNNIDIQCKIANQVLQTQITGNTAINQEQYNYNIAVYYLGLYFYYKYSIISAYPIASELKVQMEYLDKVFDYKRIESCIRKLGICINSYEAIYLVVSEETPIIPPDPEPTNFIVSVIPLNPIYNEPLSSGLILTCISDDIGGGVTVVSYVWTIESNTEGPSSLVTITNSIGIVNEALLDNMSNSGEYLIKVTATNDIGQVATTTTLIKVNEKVEPVLFSIDAGEDQILNVTSFTNISSSTVSLGGGSSVVSYEWVLLSTDSEVDISSPNILSPNESATSITVLEALVTYVFQVTAVNDISEIATDTVTVFIYPNPPSETFVVFVREDTEIEDDTINLYGYVSGGIDGPSTELDTILWTLDSMNPSIGTPLPTIVTPNNLITQVTGLQAGVEYMFTLEVTTTANETSSATQVITVI